MRLRNNGGGLIHHSDQVFQYCSAQYIKMLKENGIEISMSGKANPYDNAKMESFFRTLKVGEVYMSDYESCEDVLAGVPYLLKRCTTGKDYILPWAICPLKNLKINLIKTSLISWS